MPSTYEDRRSQVSLVVDDELISFKETLEFILNWTRYEWALLSEAKAQRRVEKYTTRLQNSAHVFNARHEMKDL